MSNHEQQILAKIDVAVAAIHKKYQVEKDELQRRLDAEGDEAWFSHTIWLKLQELQARIDAETEVVANAIMNGLVVA